MTILLGPHRNRIKIVALDSLEEGTVSYPQETSLHVFVDGAHWTISGADDSTHHLST